MQALFQRLRAPFPYTPFSKRNVVRILGVGGFIAVCLQFFYSLQFEDLGYPPLVLPLLFGACSVLVALIFDVVVDRFLRYWQYHQAWTFNKWIAYMSALLLSIAVANYGLLLFLTGASFTVDTFLDVASHTAAVGLFPVIVSGYANQLWVLRNSAKPLLAHEQGVLETQHAILLASQNGKQELPVQPGAICYIEATGNYVVVHHFHENGDVAQTMLRNTMTNIQRQVSNTPLRRCHRSFIVNPAHIKSAAGNAAGLRLHLKNIPSVTIPVSRTYVSSFRSLL